MDFDPLNLKKFGESTYKVFLYIQIAALGCLVGSVLCFILSLLSSHGSQVSTVNSDIAVLPK